MLIRLRPLAVPNDGVGASLPGFDSGMLMPFHKTITDKVFTIGTVIEEL